METTGKDKMELPDSHRNLQLQMHFVALALIEDELLIYVIHEQ